jgi:dipeptidyl aminopeptidase/acylaminoacyl peptidase
LTEGLQAIYRADLVGGQWYINRITGADLWYDFDSPFYVREVEGVTELLTSYRSMDFPNELVCVKVKGLKEGVACMVEGCEDCFKVEPITKENEHILSQLAEHKTEARYVKTVDGKDMLTWVLFPPDFDPNKKYPSILICLGGPQGTLSQGWSYRWNYRLMASQGYVVVLPNRRGTTAFGQEWCEQISGDYCGLNIQDYLSAARSVKAEPYIDKMAACGASYGGFSVYYLCGNHENTFDAFIAHAGIFNQEHMYMTTEELWFPTWDNGGAPWDNNPTAKRHYANSAHKFIKNWHTPLMVIHGAMDFRVPLDQGMAAFNAAQMMGVPSKMLVFPDENHWILKPQNAMFWHREYFDWLDKWCK